MDNWLPFATAIVGGLIVWLGNRAVNQAKAMRDRAEGNAIDVETFRKLIKDVQELQSKVDTLEVKNRALWQYILALLEQMKKHKIKPPDPPRELDSDPEIIKLLQEIREQP